MRWVIFGEALWMASVHFGSNLKFIAIMEELTRNEQIMTFGGHDGSSYQAGVFVGDLIEVAITVFGVGRLLRFVK